MVDNTGIVHQHVQGTKSADRFVHQAYDVRGFGDVRHDGCNLSPARCIQLRGRCLERRLVARADDDIGAFGGQGTRDALADSLTGPGYQRDLAF